MGTISVTWPSDGQTIDAADVSTPGNIIVNAINGNLDSNNVSAGGLTPNNLTAGTGSSWAYQSYVPTFTNFSLGNGTINFAKYVEDGKNVRLRVRVTLGSTSSVSGSIVMSLPVAANSDYTSDDSFNQTTTIKDSGTAFFEGWFIFGSSTTLALDVKTASGSFVGQSGTSSTVPMTWATSDQFSTGLDYEGA